MDIVHHSLIGGAGLLVATTFNEPAMGVAFLAGSVFPDLDVLFMTLGKRFYLKNHQGVTHSIILAPIFALLLIAIPISALPYVDLTWQLFAGALFGITIHVLLDLCNTFRIGILIPLTKTRFSLDAIFFIDSITLMLTGLFYLSHFYLNSTAHICWYPIAFVIYVIGKIILQRQVRLTLECDSAIPSAWNPFEFYILKQSGEQWYCYLYNCLTQRKKRKQQFTVQPTSIRDTALKSPVFRDLSSITRNLQITSVTRDQGGRVDIEAKDLTIRNFGGKFGSTTLSFDKDDNILNETAAI